MSQINTYSRNATPDRNGPPGLEVGLENCQESSGSTGFWKLTSMRLHVTLLLCFFVFTNCVMRTNLSMGMVCMVNTTSLELHSTPEEESTSLSAGFGKNNTTLQADTTVISDDAKSCELPTVAKADYEGIFIWTSSQQGMLFAAIFWGGLLSVFPAGWLADRYGPKNIMLGSVMLGIMGSFLSPVSAQRGGFVALFIVRFIMGVAQGVQYPCAAAMMSRWIPPTERSTVIAIFTAGNQIASIIIMPLGAWLCSQKDFLGGWPAIFYTAGSFGVLWCILWAAFLTNTPEKNRKISNIEKEFIAFQLENQNLQNRKAATKHIPWLSMIKSGPMMANFFATFMANVLGATLQSYLPTYFRDVLFLELSSNGFYSALPFLAQWLTKFVLAPIADRLKKQSKLSHTSICKIFQAVGCFGTSILLICLSFVDCTLPGVALFLLCAMCACFGAMICGFLTSEVSIAPNLSGIVNSFSRIAGMLGGLGAPYFIGFTTVHAARATHAHARWLRHISNWMDYSVWSLVYQPRGTQSEWRTVFLTMAAFDIFCGVFYMMFGSAEIQEWAQIPTSPKLLQLPIAQSSSRGSICDEDGKFSKCSNVDAVNECRNAEDPDFGNGCSDEEFSPMKQTETATTTLPDMVSTWSCSSERSFHECDKTTDKIEKKIETRR